MMHKTNQFIVLLAMGLVLGTGSVRANTGNDAVSILERVDSAGYSKTSRLFLTQTVLSPSGATRTFKMISYSMNGTEKGLTEYLSPNQVRGMKILTLGDGNHIWTYFPRTNRVRKIASSARNRKVQGSDFSYDDMAMGKMATSWSGTVAGTEKINGKECYKLSLKPTKQGPQSYSRIIAWIDKAAYTSVRVLYFDLDGEKLKQLDIGDYRKINGVYVPFSYTMINLTDGGKTTMNVVKAQVNISLDASIFTESGLGK